MKLPPTHGTAAVVLLIVSLSVPVLGADDCEAWKRSYATYEDEVTEAIQDEPEDLPRELRRHAEAVKNGQADYAERIENKIRNGLTGLLAIHPHPEMARFHTDLVACYGNAVAALDAEDRGDAAGHRAAELQTWQTFRGLIVTVRDLLAAHGCDPGEVEAIDQKFLPEIDARIEALRSESAR
jgi:hypothetical protein